MIRVRPFQQRDATQLAQIFFSAIHEIASAHYAEEQIEAWAPAVPDAGRFIARASDGRTLLIAVDEDDVPLAYGDVEPNGHIDHLFCAPAVAGRGVTALLYVELEASAKALGIAELSVEASEPAQRFFAKQGFQNRGRNDFELNGVPIHNFRMTKRLEG